MISRDRFSAFELVMLVLIVAMLAGYVGPA